MKPLSETNLYLADPQMRRRLLDRNARASSAFEGAHGLKPPADQPSTIPRANASRKKSAKSS